MNIEKKESRIYKNLLCYKGTYLVYSCILLLSIIGQALLQLQQCLYLLSHSAHAIFLIITLLCLLAGLMHVNLKLSSYIIATCLLTIIYSQLIDYPREILHIISFTILGYVVHRETTPKLLSGVLARFIPTFLVLVLFVFGASLLDELVQWLLPYRVFDVRDILINFSSGCAGLFIAWKDSEH